MWWIMLIFECWKSLEWIKADEGISQRTLRHNPQTQTINSTMMARGMRGGAGWRWEKAGRTGTSVIVSTIKKNKHLVQKNSLAHLEWIPLGCIIVFLYTDGFNLLMFCCWGFLRQCSWQILVCSFPFLWCLSGHDVRVRMF